ncbi:unnamed protein product [Sphenostylis stenocarpa]|uniref:Uncharacterized protein n=1 Tax=Sphenostylis stenocarpa TaxID=92480 RepID=A0AA86W1C1_9FABA|nr:unnamed protein product [Sphenostylis stenocarpa]
MVMTILLRTRRPEEMRGEAVLDDRAQYLQRGEGEEWLACWWLKQCSREKRVKSRLEQCCVGGWSSIVLVAGMLVTEVSKIVLVARGWHVGRESSVMLVVGGWHVGGWSRIVLLAGAL